MAADQRRKRMNSANVIGFSSREHYRAKRKKIGSSDGASRSGDHISLEWDRNRSKVVSKREQVGLSLRHLREFVDFVPSTRHNLLAQVFPVPHETFQLENLSDVLSNEVWRDCLSGDERNYLQQFLPKGTNVEQVVQQLLDGENFHFGNPFLDWGTSVCSGKAHPDQIVSQEKCLRACKRRHYSDLENYHNEAIDYLQMLKEKWESCKDTEKDAFVRSRRGIAVNGSCQNLTAVSESTSLNVDDKPCSSDNKTSSIVRNGGVQRRPKSSAAAKGTSRSPLSAQDLVVNVGVKARNKDKIPTHSIQQTDGAKYMSYLKVSHSSSFLTFDQAFNCILYIQISKKQHQIVTSMKQSGKILQSRELNQILGNINNLDVQPYGMFVEEEQKKLNAHWLQLVKGLPAAYAIWKQLQLQKRDIVNSLERDLKEKLNPWTEVCFLHTYKHDDVQFDLRNNDHESLNPSQSGELAMDDEDSGSIGQVSAKNHSLSKNTSSYGDQITDSGRCLQVGTYPSQVSSPDCDNDINSEDIEGKQYSSPSRCHGLNQKDVEANDYSNSIQGQFLPPASFSSEPHASNLDETIQERVNVSSDERIPCIPSSHGEDLQFCSGGNVWRPVEETRQSYIGRQAYTPGGGLSIIHNPEGVEEEKNCFIDQRKAANSFGTFPNNDQNELLQTLFKDQGLASRSTEQFHSLLKVPLINDHKQIAGIGFQQGGSNNLMEGNQFSGQYQHQMTTPQALSQGQHSQIDIYGQGNMPGNMYSDGRGFMMQRPDWNTNVSQIGVTTHPHLNTVPLLNESWQYKSMWPNTNVVGFASQSGQTRIERDQNLLRVATNNSDQITHRGNSSDQSLFSVLSQCSQLRRSRSAFEPEITSDQVVTPGNYGMIMGGVGTTQVGSNLVQPTNPLDYLSGSNPSTSLMPDDVGWMNQSRQNSGLHDPLGKLYPRSWNP
ncbi:unnamed protein product [Cochlearia groenlandica]